MIFIIRHNGASFLKDYKANLLKINGGSAGIRTLDRL